MKLQDQENFDRPKSLGFQLVNALVKQLQGTIEITQSPGTEFKIKFFDTNH
jgi:two-component sensor histidine kinase